MDLSLISSLLPILIQIVNSAGSIQNTIRTGGNVVTLVQKLMPDVMPILQQIGTLTFPSVDPAKATSAAIDVIFDNDGTKWVQNTLNLINKNTDVVVDGAYGSATKAAVSAYQTKHSLKVDGWAGPKTSGSMAVEAAKLATA